MNATNSCALMDELRPDGAPHKKQIQFIKDRPGHDSPWRYAVDTTKLSERHGVVLSKSFKDGLYETVSWYVKHYDWLLYVLDEKYRSDGERCLNELKSSNQAASEHDK